MINKKGLQILTDRINSMEKQIRGLADKIYSIENRIGALLNGNCFYYNREPGSIQPQDNLGEYYANAPLKDVVQALLDHLELKFSINKPHATIKPR